MSQKYAIELKALVPGTDTLLLKLEDGREFELIVDMHVIEMVGENSEAMDALQSADDTERIKAISHVYEMVSWTAQQQHPGTTPEEVKTWFKSMAHFVKFSELFMQYFNDVASGGESEQGTSAPLLAGGKPSGEGQNGIGSKSGRTAGSTSGSRRKK